MKYLGLGYFAWDFFILIVMQNRRTYKQNLAKIYLKNKHEFDKMLIKPTSLLRIIVAFKKFHKNGVNKPCSLNKILNFHILENNTLDPMYIMLEGVIPFE